MSGTVLLGIVKTLRPKQWVKNLFVIAPVVFAKNLFQADVVLHAIAAFFVFSFLAGAIYTINDLVDADADRNHPTKKNRPIAAGRVSVGAAKATAVVLVLASLGAATALSYGVAICAVIYLANNLAYTFKLKHIAYIDVASISFGFVLRVLAGCYAVSTPAHPVRPSVYLIACTALLALFLGFGKRRHELKANSAKARATLESYNPRTLTAALYGIGVLTVVSYVMYTIDRDTRAFFHTDYLWLTTPFVVVALGIFIQLVRDESRLDSPTDEMLKNVPFMLTLVAWAVTILTIVYKLRPGT